MTTDTPISVQVSHRYTATAEQVFDAFLDPEMAGRFMFATPYGEMVRVEIDARVGGSYVFTDRRYGQDVVHSGEYVELERPRRLAFTFRADGSEADLVVIEIVDVEGGCEATLTHEMSARWVEYVEQTERGWAGILAGAAAGLSRSPAQQ